MSKITCNLKTIAFREFCVNMLFSYFWVSYNIVKFQTCSSWHSWVIATFRLSLLSKSLITSKLLHLEYLVLMLFTYFRVSCKIVKFQTCGSLHSWVIATLRFLLNTKSFITQKLLHLEHFVKICYSATFSIATTWWVTWVSISIAKWVIGPLSIFNDNHNE